MRSKPTYDVTFDYSLYLWKFEEFWSSFHAKIWLKKKGTHEETRRKGKEKMVRCPSPYFVAMRGAEAYRQQAYITANLKKKMRPFELWYKEWSWKKILYGKEGLVATLQVKIEWFPLSPILFTINFLASPSKNFSINSSIGFETLESLEFFENLLVMIYNL